MKTKALMTLLAVGLTTFSCTNEQVGNQPIPLRLSTALEMQTRGIQDTQLSNGEKVYVWVRKFVDDNQVVYNANILSADGSGGLTGTTPMFFPQDGGKVNIYAIHGNLGSGGISSGDGLIISRSYIVLADQSTASNVAKSDLLFANKKEIAHTATAVPLTFYHMLSKVQIAIKIGTGDPVLKSSGAVKLNGVNLEGTFVPNRTADVTSQAARASMITGLASLGNITTTQKLTTDFASPDYNEFIVAPQSIAGKKLSIELNDGGVLNYTFPAGTTLVSGKKYLFHVTLNLTGLTVSTSISDWEPVNPVSGNAILE